MIKLQTILFFIVVIISCKNSQKETDNKVNQLKHLASPADSLSAEPYLFSDKNGLVHLSWIEKRKEKSFLKFSVLNEEQWSKPKVISSGDDWFVNWADYPLITTDGSKNMIAHFLEKSEKGTYTYDIKLVVSADLGKTWSEPKILHDDGKKAEHGFVSVIPYSENYFISWLDGRNTVTEGAEGHHEGHHGQMTLRGALVD